MAVNPLPWRRVPNRAGSMPPTSRAAMTMTKRFEFVVQNIRIENEYETKIHPYKDDRSDEWHECLLRAEGIQGHV